MKCLISCQFLDPCKGYFGYQIMCDNLPFQSRNIKTILGIRIDDYPLDFFLQEIVSRAVHGKKTVISYVNIHAVNLAFERPAFRSLLNSSNLSFCDGFGIILASLIVDKNIHHRYTPPDFIERLCGLAELSRLRVFFLGSRIGSVEQAASVMKASHPSLEIAWHHGFFDKSYSSPENLAVVDKINAFETDILFIGFGMPLQEDWISQNFHRLSIKIAFPVGALFDYMAETVPRAPRWMTDWGLEWLGRLVFEPRRLWKRYILGNPLFFWRVFNHHILKFPLPE